MAINKLGSGSLYDGVITGAKLSTTSLSTSNVVEGINLYFSNARVYSNITSLSYASTTYVDNKVANLVASAPAALDTLYELAAALGNDNNFSTTVLTSIGNKANTTSLTTANVTELNNLYFTNARVYSNVTQIGYITASALTGYATNAQLATYATNSQLATYATNAQLATYATNAQLATYATNSQLSLYATNSQLSSYALTSSLTTANVTELINLYYTDSRVYTNVIQLGYITSSALSGYATNTQLASYATTANLALKANIVDLTTANVTELNNLYFTNARVYSNVVSLGYITNSVLIGYATNNQLATYATNAQLATYATNAQLALYATNSQLASYATTANLALKANIVDLTTANVSELTNLYFSNIRVSTAISTQTLTNATFTGNVTAAYLIGDGSALTNLPSTLPSQTGNSGKYLTTNGTTTSWATVEAGFNPFLLAGM